MAEVISKIPTAINYDGVVLRKGANIVDGGALVKLRANSAFRIHEAAGHVSVVAPVEPPKPAPPPPKPVAAEPALDAAAVEFLTAYDAMSADEQDMLYPTLPDLEKAIVDEHRKSK